MNSIKGKFSFTSTYYQDPNIENNLVNDHVKNGLDMNMIEVMVIKPYMCKVLDKLQRTSKVS